MSACGCDFTSANGLFISSGTSGFDPATSNDLYLFTYNSSNINYNYSSNKLFFTDSNISNIYWNNGLTDSNISNIYWNNGLTNSNVSNLLYFNDSNVSNIYYNTGYIDSNLLWWRYELLNTQLELANTKITVAGLNTSLNITTTTVSAQGFTLGVHTGQIDVLESKVENLENNTFTKLETSNIFTTSNVASNTSNTLADYNNLYNRPLIFTQIETSNIFTTSNVLSNTSNILADYNNLYNRPDVYTKTEIDINNYTKIQTDNTFTSLTQSNLLYLSLKNDISNTNNNNKWIVDNNNLYTLDYNIGIGKNNPNYKVDINGSLSSTDYRFNDKQLFSLLPADSPIFNSGISTQLSPTEYFVSYTQNSTMILNKSYTVDILIVAAGGRGGSSYYGGGGGAGEVIYIPNYTLNTGVYNITVGIDSATPANRISKLQYQTTLTDLITAIGGGDGGLNLFLTSTTTGIIINNKCSIKYNDESFNDLNPSTYNITFNNGSITLLDIISSSSIVDKSYPNIKDTSQVIINPTAWYKFDDSTNRGLDTMNVANMTNVNNVSTTTGLRGGLQAVFNGTNQYLSTTTFPNINAKSFSFTFWCKCTATTTQTRTIFGYNAGGSITTRTGFMLYMGAGNQFVVRFGNDDLVYTSPSTYQNRLVFFAITFNITGFVQKLYENGVEVATRNAGGGLNLTTPGSMAIGRRNFNSTQEYFGGEIDDFRIYNNRVLTPDEINEIYKGRVNLYNQVNSGGSGGGGGGGNITTSFNQNGAAAGTPFNITYSKLTAGANGITANGGNGGSALISGRYTDPISGIQVGAGGTGATSSSTPTTKINYGDGGDGNGGFGRQGIIIFKFTGDIITKFLEYADYNKLFNKPNLLTKEETSNIFTTSNVAENTSNMLSDFIKANSNSLGDYTSITSNNLNIFIKANSNNLSDYVNYTSNILGGYVNTTSNILGGYTNITSNNLNIFIKANSNILGGYVNTTSNILGGYVNTTSNILGSYVNNNYYNKIQIDNFNSYRPMTSNITQKLTGSIVSLTLVNGGSGYASFLTNQPLIFTGGGGQNASGTYNTNGSGSVSSITLTDGGILYTSTNVVVKAGTGNAVITANMGYFDFHNVYSALNVNGKPSIVYERCDLAFGTRDPNGISYQENPDATAGALGTNGFCGLRVKDERMFLITNSNLLLTSFHNTYLSANRTLSIASSTSNIELACNNVNSQIVMKSKTTFEKEVIFTGGVSKKIPKYFTTSRIASFDGIQCLAFDINLQTNGVNTTTILGYVFRVFRISFFFITKAPRFQWTPRTYEVHMSSFDANSVSAFDGFSAYSSLDKSYNYQWFLYRQNFSQISFCCPTSLFGTTHLDVGFVLEDLLAI